MVVQTFEAHLKSDFDVVGVCHHGDEVLRSIDDAAPDIVLLDIHMPGRNGLELVPVIRQRHPAVKILMVTMFRDRNCADQALAAGAHGFVPKDDSIQDLRTAIHEVLAGRRFVSRSVPPHSQQLSLAAAHHGLFRLTPRQQQIVMLIGLGLTTLEIATRLRSSHHTISWHRKGIRRVLGIGSEHGLLLYAMMVAAGTSGAEPLSCPVSTTN